jgi:uncharacterized membrane protein YcaP (DUF421 family)
LQKRRENTVAQLAESLQFVFGGDVPVEPLSWHQVMARAAVIYVLGIVLVRLGKSRMLSRLSAMDVLVGFVLGSLLSRGITGHASISGTAASGAALVAVHWLFSRVASDFHWFGNLVKGRIDLLVKDGQPLEEAMKRHHISKHDLEEEFRQDGIDDLSAVKMAYKERSGEVSVIPRKSPPRIVEVQVQPGVQTVRIQLEA